ncbi:hypothetical protein DPMN_176781 [Dreissena polymorpha]|uniref:Uncharacterized protein n=1 Tax=Dreissena polymorpha TaxID=45954 RepID=A0A9D4EAI6_DREPO|nr:hypothetical protein DPMN_176781 [Dreissena polymorpha]
MDNSCTDDIVRGAEGQHNLEQSMHVYNRIMLGRGENACHNENGVICSDEYSHISIDGIDASGDGRYYNVVNINAGRSEATGDYCHIGPNNANFNAHVTCDDYNHVVL